MSINLEELRAKLDPGDMYGRVAAFPEQMKDAWSIGQQFAATLEPSHFDKIVVCGMGGSAIGGDMARSFFGDRLTAPLISCRDYSVPTYLRDGSLAVISSYSGNTGETLSAYDSLRGGDNTIIAISSGGELEQRCLEDGVPFCRIPGGMPPRSAIGYSLLPMIQVLRAKAGGLFEDAEYREALALVEDACSAYAIGEADNRAVAIARALHGKMPVIYSGPGLFEALARRWACQLNENAKTPAHFAMFPELNHNEIVGWQVLEDVLARSVIISLEDVDDHDMTQRHTDVNVSIVEPLASEVIRIKGGDGGRLGRLLATMILGDFISVYLALLNGVDPTPVDKIDYLKSQLNG